MSVLIKKPISFLNRNIEVNFKDLFKSGFNVGAKVASGNWCGAASNATDIAKSLGLEKLDPGQVGWLLIGRALGRAIQTLVGERPELKQNAETVEKKINQINFSTLEERELEITSDFFEQPKALPILEWIKEPLIEVLTSAGLKAVEAREISNRLPSYFVLALNEEWREKSEFYTPLQESLNTPFTKASEREQVWRHYSAWLQKQVEEPVFGEPFSLKRIYIPLRAYYEREKQREYDDEESREISRKKQERVVIDLEQELTDWVQQGAKEDAIRAISGGPGSGKSSFSKMFAAQLAEQQQIPVLLIPLHLLDPTADLVTAVQEFTRLTKILNRNPLDSEQGEPKLLIIFDGLDELSTQGKLAEEVTRQFVEEVERKVSQFNFQDRRLLVLLSGREIVVQALESKLRQQKQVLYLLPYFVSEDERRKEIFIFQERYDYIDYIDEDRLLRQDQRQHWWHRYGKVRGDDYEGLPAELSRPDLEEITAQPLLNYLVALSFTRGEIDLSTESNLNVIYEDLLKAVYERKWGETKGFHPATGELDLEKFIRVLEEIAIATWHGNGRRTTLQAIEERCRSGRIEKYLQTFQEGAKAGVTRLLTAFYFRQSGFDQGEETFEFTHKSFSEYLTAKRITRELKKLAKKLQDREDDPDEGWDEKEALKSWAMLCGPSAMDEYLHRFLLNEFSLQGKETVCKWQETLCHLIGFMLKHAMPMEKLDPRLKFQEECRQARNAEEALLVALSSCASITEERSSIEWPTPNAFGTWLGKLRGQRYVQEKVLALACLNFLELEGTILFSQELIQADLRDANLSSANLSSANLSRANLSSANLSAANLRDANLSRANLSSANLSRAVLRDSDLSAANLSSADLIKAVLITANFSGAVLSGAGLSGANFSGAVLSGAGLSSANLSGAVLISADLSDAVLSGADLSAANLELATNLTQKQIDAAKGNSQTRLPEGLTRPQRWEDE